MIKYFLNPEIPGIEKPGICPAREDEFLWSGNSITYIAVYGADNRRQPGLKKTVSRTSRKAYGKEMTITAGVSIRRQL
jgi:hypothetical protein